MLEIPGEAIHRARQLGLAEYDEIYRQLGSEIVSIATNPHLPRIRSQVSPDEAEFLSILEGSYVQASPTVKGISFPALDTVLIAGKVFLDKIDKKLKGLVCSSKFLDETDRNALLSALIVALISGLSIPAPYAGLATVVAALLVKTGLKEYCTGQ